MKVTIIEKQEFEKGKLLYSKERHIYPNDMEEFKNCVRGWRAEKIKIELEFGKDDVKDLIDFARDSQPCFG